MARGTKTCMCWKTGLNINIDLRADRIDLEGAARDVARAEQIFSDFESLRKSGTHFQ